MRKLIAGVALAATMLAGSWAQDAAAQTLRVGHILSETHPGHIALTEIGETLKQESDGGVLASMSLSMAFSGPTSS